MDSSSGSSSSEDEELTELMAAQDGHDRRRRPAEQSPSTTTPSLTSAQAARLYVSHAFSTWNARGYEFAAILFTAAAYPDTLVAAALRMIIIYLAMIVLSSSIGGWVQNAPDRLRTLLTTVAVNRTSVIIGSLFWLLILSQEDLVKGETVFVLPKNDGLKHVIFVVAVAFGIIERLSSSGNLISMERDWVVTVAAAPGRPYDLTHLNAVMRRIDLVCKPVSPILISVVISASGSVRIGVLYSALTSLVSIPIEIVSAKGVWNSSPVLRVPKSRKAPSGSGAASVSAPTPATGLAVPWTSRVRQCFVGFEMYFSTTVWVPSIALALLHFNMMTWRATFITYLINIGYSLPTITLARAMGSVFEISSTVATPLGIQYMGKAYGQHRSLAGEEDELEVGLIESNEQQQQQHTVDGQTLVGLQRFGLWGVSWQVLNLAPVLAALWAISLSREGREMTSSPASSTSPDWGWSLVIFSFLSFSRFGVWVFDLTTQQLTQVLVPEHQRSKFAGVETSVVNVFEILGAAAAISFPRTEQFKWLALASFVAVTVSWALYAGWVKGQRGHLLHWEKLGLWGRNARR
ncbi:Solute carrier family 40 member 1 [Apiospora hydei]|uniref:Solute carrier family 40 member n=1 Tax=Apiospora hydei TaxID=1337664 RepID=A0ABR1X187_9PEZI